MFNRKIRRGFYLALLITAIFSLTDCQMGGASKAETPKEKVEPMSNANRKDSHSFAKPDEAVVTHLDLDIALDFDKKELSGKATLQIDNKTKPAQLMLDTRDLTITRVTL